MTPEEWRERAASLSARGQNVLALIVTLSASDVATIHALTRKVTISNDELIKLCQNSDWPDDPRLPVGYGIDKHKLADLQDIRDRYEERGKYAVRAVSAPESNSDPTSRD